MTKECPELKFVKCIEKENDKQASELAAPIDRYLNYVLRFEKIESLKYNPILLVEIDDNWDSDSFYSEKISEERNDKYVLKDTLKNISGILFFTFEEFPRGDGSTSGLNKSRMLREFFENSFTAVTANHKDVFNKIYLLTRNILENSKVESPKFEKVFQDLTVLKEGIALLKKDLNTLANGYPYGGIHTKDGHKNFRKFINASNTKGKRGLIGFLAEIMEMEENYDLASIIANNPLQYNKPFKILIIDDNHKYVKKDIQAIKGYLPANTEIYITGNREWGKIRNEKSTFWESMYNKKAVLGIKEISSKKLSFPEEPLFLDNVFRFNFIIVDLLLGDYNEGNQIINNLARFRYNFNRMNEEHKTYFDIITLSLSEEVYDVSRALNEGSLQFVPKKRRYMLPAVMAQLEKSRGILEKRADILSTVKKSHNFDRLSRLPKTVRRKLETEPFLDLPPENGSGWLTEFIKIPSYEWIKKMPKADIHCHLGGSLRGECAFFLSLNMLVPECEYSNYIEKTLTPLMKKYFDFIAILLEQELSMIKNLFKIFQVVLKIILKFDLDEVMAINDIKKEKIVNFLIEEEEKTKDEIAKAVFSSIKERLNSCTKEKKVKKWILSIVKQSEGFFNDPKLKKEDFDEIVVVKKFLDILHKMNNKMKRSVPYFQVINIFHVLIGWLESKSSGDIENFWKRLDVLKDVREKYNKQFNSILVPDDDHLEGVIKKNKQFWEKLKESGIIPQEMTEELHEKEILIYFMSAKQRKTESLADYLGGCEFLGAAQLRNKENILAALFSIIKKNVDDNVRLLELKLSPDGYINDKLTLQEAVQTVLLGTDLITLYFYKKGRFIRVNYIFTVKRHKPPEQAALEVSAAIVNKERGKLYKAINIEQTINKDNVDILKYKWEPSKVAGIDLAGLEKGNPARNFVNDFYPLFKTSSFITIHAGEEETAQSIWEAVYLLHANRIGHGLTLNEKLQLKDLFKNLQICLEMNPISNMYTNPGITDRYPFFEFVREGLKVTINTDNPAISDSTLSEEFVKAAELFQKHRNNTKRDWMSKWEILRVLKNAFSSSFLNREEKRQLMRAVEEEIYQKIIEEYGL